MWVDAQFYVDEFLLGRPPLIPPEEFRYWSLAAEERINWRHVTLDDAPEYLKRCVCKVAELLWRAEQGPKPGELIGESNADYSWKAQGAQSASAVNSEINAVIIAALAGTELHNDFISRRA